MNNDLGDKAYLKESAKVYPVKSIEFTEQGNISRIEFDGGHHSAEDIAEFVRAYNRRFWPPSSSFVVNIEPGGHQKRAQILDQIIAALDQAGYSD